MKKKITPKDNAYKMQTKEQTVLINNTTKIKEIEVNS